MKAEELIIKERQQIEDARIDASTKEAFVDPDLAKAWASDYYNNKYGG